MFQRWQSGVGSLESRVRPRDRFWLVSRDFVDRSDATARTDPRNYSEITPKATPDYATPDFLLISRKVLPGRLGQLFHRNRVGPVVVADRYPWDSRRVNSRPASH